MTVTAVEGFVAAGIAAGIKASRDPDLALVATDDGRPVDAAGVFTQNRMCAAPVQVSRHHLQVADGRAAAVVLNSGNANAATGEPGVRNAEAMTTAVAAELGCDRHHVLVCSTGLIGIPLPVERIEAAIPSLVAARSAEGGSAAARAIMTTDTRPKEVVVHEAGITVGGIAKGAAMLAPNMATMLAVLTTDATATPEQLRSALRHGVRDSFNALSVDGCTSTNDTVLLLASGRRAPGLQADLERAVAEACAGLAAQMAGDAEGATKVVRVKVVGASSDEEASRAARRVADSALCKCSWYGEDPYWGRVASELGSAGVHFDPTLVSIAYGDVTVARHGVEVDHDREAVRAHLTGRELELTCNLGVGAGRGVILTNDLTHAYIDENRGTS